MSLTKNDRMALGRHERSIGRAELPWSETILEMWNHTLILGLSTHGMGAATLLSLSDCYHSSEESIRARVTASAMEDAALCKYKQGSATAH